MNGQWLTITEYSQVKKVSISTVRRYIKSGHVKSEKKNGKYFIHVSDENLASKKMQEEKDLLRLKLKVSELENELRRLKEENDDLKMLVQLYEGKSHQGQDQLPDLPMEAN